jgi:very-short-patch-repair endonuclease
VGFHAHVARRAEIPPDLVNRPFSLRQARDAGLNSRRLRGKTWRRLGGSIYSSSTLLLTPFMLLDSTRWRLPPEAAFSGRTAAWLHGLDLVPDDPFEATVSPAARVSARAGVDLRRAELAEIETVVVEGFRVTSIRRTLLDLSLRLSLVEATVAADAALHLKRLAMSELVDYSNSVRGRKGAARLRKVAELAEPLAESPMETRLRVMLMRAGLPRPQAQVELFDSGGCFVGRPDLYYPKEKLGIEYDGGAHRDQLAEDNRRQNRILGAGYRLLRFSASDLQERRESVIAQVRTALKSTSAGGWS